MSLSDRNCHSLVVLPKLFENSWPLSAHIHLDQSESSTTEVAGILASCPLRALVSEGTIVLYHLKSPCQAYRDVIKLSIFYDIATLCSHADPAVISITNIPQGTWYQRLNFRLGLWYWDTVETWRSRAYGMKISGDVIKEGCGSLCLYHLPSGFPTTEWTALPYQILSPWYVALAQAKGTHKTMNQSQTSFINW